MHENNATVGAKISFSLSHNIRFNDKNEPHRLRVRKREKDLVRRYRHVIDVLARI